MKKYLGDRPDLARKLVQFRALKAMLKSNGKYSCESTGGYEQKATNESDSVF